MSKEVGGQVAKVILDVPGLGALDYRVPTDMMVAVGDRVLVSLQRRKVIGIVSALQSIPDTQKRLSNVLAVLTETTPLREEWLALTRFAAQYYLRSWGEAAVPALPSFFRKVPGARRNASLEKIRTLTKHTPKAAPPRPVLNDEQARAVQAVIDAKGYSPFLLFGVTGSGKTEVYLNIIENVLSRDPHAQVLLMVPEINLTPQLEARVRERFPEEVVVSLHSEFSDTERARAWLAVHEGRSRILVGTRLSVFASFKKLALIIVDEEHDISFKAGDGLRFSARDLSVWRAFKNKCSVVLGSATPSLESWLKAKKRDYTLLELKERAVAHASLPEIVLVNLGTSHSSTAFRKETYEQMRETLEEKRQILVFINRRGYAPVLSCPSCGWISSCPRCSTFTVFHKREKTLVCHHCGYSRQVPECCPSCGNVDILPKGTGTERIEEELSKLFPQHRILRIDRDSVRRKNDAQKAFESVHKGEVDILVGTQMIAKGHDFQNVGLVVILNADSQIVSPDARAKEHLFSTLMQVSGRAGRHGERGKVLIQTRYPTEPLFSALIDQNYPLFADTLLAQRETNYCVPYVYQALLTAQAKTITEALYFLKYAADIAWSMDTHEVRVFDPVPMTLVRLMDMERGQLLVEADSRMALNRFLVDWLARLQSPSSISWTIEIDPMDI